MGLKKLCFPTSYSMMQKLPRFPKKTIMAAAGLIALLILVPAAFAQYPIDTGDACINDCILSCAGSSDPTTCGYNCAVSCGYGGGIGITNPDPCEGVTTPAGYPTKWTGASCEDPYAAEHYCGQAASCNACQNRPAYSCIWNGACVPCKSGSCSYSCGGGGYYTNGGNNGGGGNNGVDTGPTEDPCGAYASCNGCTNAAQGGNPDLEFCAWFPVEGICHDRRVEALTVITRPEDCGTNAGSNGAGGGGTSPGGGGAKPPSGGGGAAGSRAAPCLPAIGLFALPLLLFQRSRSARV